MLTQHFPTNHQRPRGAESVIFPLPPRSSRNCDLHTVRYQIASCPRRGVAQYRVLRMTLCYAASTLWATIGGRLRFI